MAASRVEIHVHSIDYDGCYNEADFLDRLSKGYRRKNLILMVGSNRQCGPSNFMNWMRNGNGCCFTAMTKLKAKLKASGVNCQLDPYLLADTDNGIENGQSFNTALTSKAFTGYEPPCYSWDESKIRIFYAQMHKIAAENPDANIVYEFSDDRREMLAAISKLIEKFKPGNVRIKLSHTVDGKLHQIVGEHGYSLQPIDFNWRKNVARLTASPYYASGRRSTVLIEKMEEFLASRSLAPQTPNVGESKEIAFEHRSAPLFPERVVPPVPSFPPPPVPGSVVPPPAPSFSPSPVPTGLTVGVGGAAPAVTVSSGSASALTALDRGTAGSVRVVPPLSSRAEELKRTPTQKQLEQAQAQALLDRASEGRHAVLKEPIDQPKLQRICKIYSTINPNLLTDTKGNNQQSRFYNGYAMAIDALTVDSLKMKFYQNLLQGPNLPESLRNNIEMKVTFLEAREALTSSNFSAARKKYHVVDPSFLKEDDQAKYYRGYARAIHSDPQTTDQQWVEWVDKCLNTYAGSSPKAQKAIEEILMNKIGAYGTILPRGSAIEAEQNVHARLLKLDLSRRARTFMRKTYPLDMGEFKKIINTYLGGSSSWFFDPYRSTAIRELSKLTTKEVITWEEIAKAIWKDSASRYQRFRQGSLGKPPKTRTDKVIDSLRSFYCETMLSISLSSRSEFKR